MGTATASTTLAADDETIAPTSPPLRTDRQARLSDAVEIAFEITQRGQGEGLPPRDGLRVAAMRRIAQARLNLCGLSQMADDVTLIVSELVTNAIIHSGGTWVSFRMRLHFGVLYLGVKSDVAGAPAVGRSDADSEHGRGLELVEALTFEHGGSWGVSPDTTTTWCTLAVPGAHR
jgi:anti-sigma regulatory factor (Ser/Thr protein kinase)